MGDKELSGQILGLVAERFRALGERARLEILQTLRQGEKTVSHIVDATGLGQANVSKHLQLLHSLGFVSRRREGPYVYYQLSDPEVFRLCDIMCGRLEAEAESLHVILRDRERTGT